MVWEWITQEVEPDGLSVAMGSWFGVPRFGHSHDGFEEHEVRVERGVLYMRRRLPP
jgi:hypothetical protein